MGLQTGIPPNIIMTKSQKGVFHIQIQSINGLKKKLNNYPHLDELEDFLQKIEKKDLKLVLLFGSLVKGTYTQFSDIDVLCVFETEFKNRRERFMHSYQYSKGLVQTKTLTLSELKKGLLEGNSFIHHVINEGIILYNQIDKEKIKKWIRKGQKNMTMTYFPPS